MKIQRILVCAILCISPCLAEMSIATTEPLGIEVEIVKGRKLSRLFVFIRNNTNEPVQFPNGAYGGPGSLVDRVGDEAQMSLKMILGSPPTVLPEIDFKYAQIEEGFITLVTPAFGGLTRHSMRPHFVMVPAKSRVLYSSFVVPTIYTEGGFIQARVTVNPKRVPGFTGKLEFKLVTTEIVERKLDAGDAQQTKD